MPCPQCGAPVASSEVCQDLFTAGQLKEIEQPGYYAVHHLSVPSYLLQHNVYSRAGWLQVYALLFDFVHGGLTPEQARRRDRNLVDSGRRTWSFVKGTKLPGVEAVEWRLTVADVRLDTADHYCADVRRWAASLLADSADLIAASKT